MLTAPNDTMTAFHLACPIKDKEETRAFYTHIVGCTQGREADSWIDFNFFGHQVSFHIKPECFVIPEAVNIVDGKHVPVRHFGAVLGWEEWHALRDRLIKFEIQFIITPYIRFKGEIGEQATMFFRDPSGNALEFKSFKNKSQIFVM